MTEHLDDFFGSRPGDKPDVPPAEPAPAPPAPTPEPPPAEPPEPPEPDEPIPEPKPGDRTVPLTALQAERAARQDYKTQAAAAQAELKAVREQQERDRQEATKLQQQLEELRKAPPPPAASAPPMPNPVEDPEGYRTFLRNDAWNDLCNRSEAAFKQSHPDADIQAMTARLAQEVAANPQLGTELRAQFHPYEWLANKIKKLDGLKQIGDDPDAFRAKVEADAKEKLRAEIMAEMQQAPAAPAKPAVRLPGSLAGVPSAGDRAPNPYTGPTPLEDVLGR